MTDSSQPMPPAPPGAYPYFMSREEDGGHLIDLFRVLRKRKKDGLCNLSRKRSAANLCALQVTPIHPAQAVIALAKQNYMLVFPRQDVIVEALRKAA